MSQNVAFAQEYQRSQNRYMSRQADLSRPHVACKSPSRRSVSHVLNATAKPTSLNRYMQIKKNDVSVSAIM